MNLWAAPPSKLREPLTEPEMQDLQDYLKGQFSDGWGESFEQQEIQTSDGVLCTLCRRTL